MSSSISFNPMLTTSAADTFLLSTAGYTQGDFLADPAARMWLVEGQVVNTASAPLWAGIPVTETTPASGATTSSTPTIAAATAETNITAFTVANQAYAGVIVPGSTAPLWYAGMTMSYLRLGSNARIVVAVDSGAVSALTGAATDVTVYWDFVNNALTNSGSTALPVKFRGIDSNSKVFTYSSGSATWSVGSVAIIQI